MKKAKPRPLVAVAMGSDTDLSVMNDAAKALSKFRIPFDLRILSAHRTPHDVAAFAEGARAKGYRVIIAGAGGAAHLPGMIASYTDLPVIGVPVPVGALKGSDAFLSIVQMPKGIPVATVAIGNAWNAGVLAAQILGTSKEKALRHLARALSRYKRELRSKVRASRRRLGH
jgi:phosphoribosylaminoimidazole carboxylase PurE protein